MPDHEHRTHSPTIPVLVPTPIPHVPGLTSTEVNHLLFHAWRRRQDIYQRTTKKGA